MPPSRGAHVFFKSNTAQIGLKFNAKRGFSDEDALRWARDDYLRDEMVRQRRALEEIAARKRGREDEHGVVILDSDDDEDAVFRQAQTKFNQTRREFIHI